VDYVFFKALILVSIKNDHKLFHSDQTNINTVLRHPEFFVLDYL